LANKERECPNGGLLEPDLLPLLAVLKKKQKFEVKEAILIKIEEIISKKP
jgi:hypothetical protein